MKRFIGNKAFYRSVLLVIVPIAIQNGITNLVNFLDNLMVGQLGTIPMSGVSITGQLIMIFNLSIFGAVSGAGIFGAQFYGSGNTEGLKHCMRYKLYAALTIYTIACVIFLTFDDQLLSLFLNDTDTASIEATLAGAKTYLRVMLPGLLPFALSQCYAGTLRECGNAVIPMKSGIIAIFVNLCLNYILIFGHFGFPAMGITGAALATVISRFAELGFLVFNVHRKKDRFPISRGLYSSLRIPLSLFKSILLKGAPLLANEFLFSLGMTSLVQCYSQRGLEVIGALNISNVMMNLFSVVMMAMGNAIAIKVGQLLGAGKPEEAIDTDNKLIAFTVTLSLAVALLLFIAAPLIPKLYNTEPAIRALAANFVRILALNQPLDAFVNSAYFTLRCGGKTIITFLFDSLFVIGVMFPLAYVLVHFTAMSVLMIYLLVHLTNLIKCVIGFILVKKRVWVNNLAASHEEL